MIAQQRCFRILAFAVCMTVSIANVSAQTAPAASASPGPAATATPAWCPLSTRVSELDATHTRFAVSFTSFDTGRASGIVALWAGDRRYDVPFHNVVAPDTRDRTTASTAIVVRFPAPTTLDGAVVTSIEDDGALRPCDPWYAPWVANMPIGPDLRTPADRRAKEQFLTAARAAVAVDAPGAIADAKPCTTPDQPGRTVFAPEPVKPAFTGTGLAVVLVLIDPSDRIVNVRLERSSGDARLDATALTTARDSEFRGQLFRCRHVMGSYIFTVQFNP